MKPNPAYLRGFEHGVRKGRQSEMRARRALEQLLADMETVTTRGTVSANVLNTWIGTAKVALASEEKP